MNISSVYKSILRSTVDLIEELKVTTGNPDILYHDWDSRGDEAKLPPVTLLGVEGFQFERNRGLWMTRYGLALSSYQDVNLLNEIDLIDIIEQRTGERSKLVLRDPVTGDQISEMVVVAWQLAPMAQSLIRNYRTMSIELLRTSDQ